MPTSRLLHIREGLAAAKEVELGVQTVTSHMEMFPISSAPFLLPSGQEEACPVSLCVHNSDAGLRLDLTFVPTHV